jgi:shikimate kinase
MISPLSQRGLVLIGMAGAGKTTVGQQLAAHWGVPFVDTDHLLEQERGESLQSLLDRLGYAAMRQVEEAFVATCNLPPGAVVATGGSVVYGPRAMRRLRDYGVCAYLQISLTTVMRRVDNWQSRGFSCAPGQTFEQVYQERLPLYQAYADLILPCDDLTPAQVAQHLEARLESSRAP